jgi:hypothetical protein
VSKSHTPLFLERQSYRGRRLIDFLRILPVIGVFLWSVPLLWPTGKESSVSISEAILYVFGVWFLMVFGSALIAFFLHRTGLDLENEDG